MSKSPSYLMMVKEDAADIQRIVQAMQFAREANVDHCEQMKEILKRVSHLEQCLDMAVAELQHAHMKATGDFQI